MFGLLRRRSRDKRREAQDALATLVRMQIGQGLAPLFLKRERPYHDNLHLKAMLDEGLLNRAAFIQKPPHLLQFYRRLLFAMDQAPTSILEVGVKGGGSTAFWKALFPSATVVGMDIKLRRWLTSEPSEDGVIYLEGDQTDVSRLKEIAGRYGPFGVVIDDGSHVASDQATTVRSLLRHVRPGGFYVVEDIHTAVKADGSRANEYGEDIWADFMQAVFEQLRKGPPPPETAGGQLAARLVPLIDDMVIGRQVLAIRVRERTPDSDGRATNG